VATRPAPSSTLTSSSTWAPAARQVVPSLTVDGPGKTPMIVSSQTPEAQGRDRPRSRSRSPGGRSSSTAYPAPWSPLPPTSAPPRRPPPPCRRRSRPVCRTGRRPPRRQRRARRAGPPVAGAGEEVGPHPAPSVHEPLGQPSPGGSDAGTGRQRLASGHRLAAVGSGSGRRDPGATGRYADLRTPGRERDLEAVPGVGARRSAAIWHAGPPGHGQARGQPATPARP
jgi:hypothetical protein